MSLLLGSTWMPATMISSCEEFVTCTVNHSNVALEMNVVSLTLTVPRDRFRPPLQVVKSFQETQEKLASEKNVSVEDWRCPECFKLSFDHNRGEICSSCKSKETENWKCSECLYVNQGNIMTCLMCRQKRTTCAEIAEYEDASAKVETYFTFQRLLQSVDDELVFYFDDDNICINCVKDFLGLDWSTRSRLVIWCRSGGKLGPKVRTSIGFMDLEPDGSLSHTASISHTFYKWAIRCSNKAMKGMFQIDPEWVVSLFQLDEDPVRIYFWRIFGEYKDFKWKQQILIDDIEGSRSGYYYISMT